MKKKFVTDTNVWYYVSNGRYQISSLKERGLVCVTPITFIELTAKINEKNFIELKKIFENIVKYADEYLDSTEAYLPIYFGLDFQTTINWKNLFTSAAKAKDFEDFKTKIDNTVAMDWRNHHYEDFAKSLLSGIKKSKVELSDEDILKYLFSNQFQNDILDAMLERAKASFYAAMLDKKIQITENDLLVAKAKLSCFIHVYSRYVAKFFIFSIGIQNSKPEFNDFADIEHFIYLQDETWIFATADKAWVDNAKFICKDKIVRIKPKKLL